MLRKFSAEIEGKPHDVRNQDDQDFILFVIDRVAGKEVFEKGNLCQTGYAVDRIRVGLLDQPAEDVDFAVLQANVMLDAALADDRLVDSADVRGTGLRRNHDVHLHADFVVRVNARRHVHVHADVEILKLRVHQGIDGAGRRAHADPGLKASGRHGNAVADAQLGGLPVDDANFRIVEDLRRRVRHQERRRRARHRHAVAVGENVRIVESAD